MAEQKKKITDFNSCPHCGGAFGYYVKLTVSGSANDCTAFDHLEKRNTEMHDGLTYRAKSEWFYCAECNKPICKGAA